MNIKKKADTITNQHILEAITNLESQNNHKFDTLANKILTIDQKVDNLKLDMNNRLSEIITEIQQNRDLIYENRNAIIENRDLIEKNSESLAITNLKLEAIAQLQNKHAAYHEEHSKRFDQIDKKLEEHDARFDEVDRKLEENNKRFDRIDKKFEEHDVRFDEVDKKLEKHDRRFDRLEEMIITNEANRQEDTKEIKMLLGNHNTRIEYLEMSLEGQDR